jgi:predicted NBD/HSP70 family sugar kinase
MDLAGVRAHNLALVLRSIHDHGPCSRTQVAARTGLTRAGAGKIVEDLIARGLVRDLGVLGAAQVGRPPAMLQVDGTAAACVGVEINRFHVATLVTDLNGREVYRARRSVDEGQSPERMLASVEGLLGPTLAAARETCRTIGRVTLAAPGIVDPERGVVVDSPALGWRDVDLRERLAELVGCPVPAVGVDSIGSLATLAESRLARYRGVTSLARLETGVGIGSGYILHGRAQRGAVGMAGTIGHCPVDPGGPVCACGRTGCLDAVAGLPALLRAAAPDLSRQDPGDAVDRVAELARRAAAQDRRALAGIAEVGTWLGRGATILINVLDPEVLVLGGFVTSLARWILPAIESELDARVPQPARSHCRVEVSALGQEGALFGAAVAGRDHLFADPVRIAHRWR